MHGTNDNPNLKGLCFILLGLFLVACTDKPTGYQPSDKPAPAAVLGTWHLNVRGTVTHKYTGAPLDSVEIRLKRLDPFNYGTNFTMFVDVAMTWSDSSGAYQLGWSWQGRSYDYALTLECNKPGFQTETIAGITYHFALDSLHVQLEPVPGML